MDDPNDPEQLALVQMRIAKVRQGVEKTKKLLAGLEPKLKELEERDAAAKIKEMEDEMRKKK